MYCITVSLGGGVYCQDLSKGCFAIQDLCGRV